MPPRNAQRTDSTDIAVIFEQAYLARLMFIILAIIVAILAEAC
jgi:hypothetical protein